MAAVCREALVHKHPMQVIHPRAAAITAAAAAAISTGPIMLLLLLLPGVLLLMLSGSLLLHQVLMLLVLLMHQELLLLLLLLPLLVPCTPPRTYPSCPSPTDPRVAAASEHRDAWAVLLLLLLWGPCRTQQAVLLLLWLLLLLQCACGAQERLQVKAHGELYGLVDLLACGVKTTFSMTAKTHQSDHFLWLREAHAERPVHVGMSSVQEVVRGYLSLLTRHGNGVMQHVKAIS
jgi:hypothetical protein